MRTLLFLCCSLILLQTCDAPTLVTRPEGPGFNDLIAKADLAEKQGNFVAAAAAFRQAFTLKPKQTDLAFRSAELSVRARDYASAADAYSLITDAEAQFPLLGLRYGRALKQAGEAREAERVLNTFQARYNGADRVIIGEIVTNELEGLSLAVNNSTTTGTVTALGPGVNTGGNETSPSLAASDRLLFASAQGGRNRLSVSQLVGSNWQRSAAPGGFPVIEGGQFGSGRFASDGREYFFTICSQSGRAESDRCEIFRTGRRLSGAWRQPLRLSESVNAAGANCAQPSAVTLEDGRQVLYFVSDRPGGRGGLDVYRSTQIDAADEAAFGEAVLLGRAINSTADETTPVFDREEQTLYFASNGHPGLGGFDLFKATRNNGTYTEAINLGPPFNSPADDVGLTLPGPTGLALFSSNRGWSPDKPGTTDDDLYQIALGAAAPLLRATTYDEATRRPVGDVEVTLLHVQGNRQEAMVSRRVFSESTYSLTLQPGTSYRVVLRRPGYQTADYRVRTDAEGASVYGRPIYLRSDGTQPRPADPPAGGESGSGRRPSISDPDSAPAAAPPTAYRIQISATKNFDPAETRYAAVKDIAELRTEAIPGRDLKRITVGYYEKIDVARAALEEIMLAGFPDAFVVRYDYGKRYGRVK